MRIDEITKGGAIELEVKCEGQNMNFKSEVEYVTNTSVLITSIMVNEQTIGFTDKYQVNFLYKVDNKLYLWENVTVKLVKYEGGVYHKIDLMGDGKFHNRRNYFRLYIGEDMPVFINNSNGPTAISALIRDISEGGVSFITKEELEVNRSMRLKLTDESLVINLSGIIVRKEFLENLGATLYGCKFTEKNVKLGRYITKKQADQLKKKTEPASLAKDKAGKETPEKEAPLKGRRAEGKK